MAKINKKIDKYNPYNKVSIIVAPLIHLLKLRIGMCIGMCIGLVHKARPRLTMVNIGSHLVESKCFPQLKQPNEKKTLNPIYFLRVTINNTSAL
jgi:hypothetical protein